MQRVDGFGQHSERERERDWHYKALYLKQVVSENSRLYTYSINRKRISVMCTQGNDSGAWTRNIVKRSKKLDDIQR
jgi:hypothetical protein